MTDRKENRSIWLMLLYACALGIAVSVTMTLSYRGILGSADENYLRIGAGVLLRGLGFAVPAFGVVWLLSRGVNRVRFTRIETGGRSMFDRRFFLLVWAALFLSWLPYLLTFYPGGVVGDGAETLEYVIQPGKINGRWGVTQILVLRGFFAVAKTFSADINTGIFLYAVCSSLAYAAVCAAVVNELRKRGLPPVLVVMCAALYAFSGHYASYSIGLWKDGLFGAGVTALSLLLWKEPEGEERNWTVKTGATLLFLCFWRNFIAYALLPVGIVLLIIRRKSRKLLAVLMILIAVFSILIQGPVYSALGITGTRISETVAIPLQQVAAVIREGTELTGEQAETLYRILPENEWKEKYAPALSDGIKYSLDDDYLKEHLWTFLKTWAQLGIRHPGTYLKAHLMETLGFWQPYGSNQGYYYDWFTGVQDIYNRGYTERDLLLEATETTLTPGLTDRLTYVPSGTVVWIMLLSLVLVLCGKGKKKHRIAALLPCLFCWMAVTVTAPIAYCYRYVEMLAICLPLFLTLPFYREEEAEAAGEKAGKIRQFLWSGEAARITAAVAAAAMVIVLICGSRQVYAFTDGKLEIRTCGAEDNHGYYIQSGLSENEGSHTWTEGDALSIAFPYHGKEKELEVEIDVAGTINSAQRYRIRNGENEQTDAGELFGAGKICFDLQAEDEKVAFTVELPDATVLPQETRKLSLATTGIEIRQKKDETPQETALQGLRILLAGDSRSSTDYDFYRETLEAKTGCTALLKGASGKDTAYNASDRYMEQITGTKHDVSVWLVGGNDDGREGTVGTFREDSELADAGEPVTEEAELSGECEADAFLIQKIDLIMRKYKAAWPEEERPLMIFCTDLPQQRDSEESPWSSRENWERKRLAIIECCEKNGIDCLDLYTLCDFDMSKEPMYHEPTDTENNRGVYYMDGLHPNPQGIDRITELEIEEIKKKLKR